MFKSVIAFFAALAVASAKPGVLLSSAAYPSAHHGYASAVYSPIATSYQQLSKYDSPYGYNYGYPYAGAYSPLASSYQKVVTGYNGLYSSPYVGSSFYSSPLGYASTYSGYPYTSSSLVL